MSFTTPLYFKEEKNDTDVFTGENVPASLVYLFDQIANRHPYNIAIKFNGSGWHYKGVFEQANRLAKILIGKGVQRGDMVGLALDRCPEMIIALLAILKAGAAYVPLDPAYPKERIDFMLADSGAKLLLTAEKYRGCFESQATEVLAEDAWKSFHEYSPDEPGVKIEADDLAYILYTSGSTGKPKGVQITHRNLVNFLTSMQELPGITPHDKVLAISTISFDIAGLEIYLPLISGAQIILASAETARDGWLLLDLIKKEEVTLVQATPYTWRMILAAGWDDFIPMRIISGGEPLPKDLANKLLPRCSEVWNQYGPTETTVYSTQKLIKSADEITIGRPVANTQVYILDERLNKVPDGEPGEIFIGGEGVAKGYLNRPELTAERFIADPFSGMPDAKMYRSGDLGSITPNGEIQCFGRIDHQVKVRGFRIELDEVEFALLRHSDVKAAVAMVRADNPDNTRLAAYIVLKNSVQGTTHEKVSRLKQALNDRLPAYMVPDDFVFINEIPVTPNGKVDRNALPPPCELTNNEDRAYVAPRTDTEKQLAQIWEKLMGLPRIGVTDNFFELGGHSLVAVQIMARIEKINGKRLPIATLLECPTIAQLAERLSGEESVSDFKSLVLIKPGGAKTPLYIVHGDGLNVLYFNLLAVNMHREQPVYGLQALGLKGEAPLEVMEDIAASYVNELVAQNPVGPYYLAGYSFGGYIALEMRKQLANMGKEVKLIIFDTDAEKSEFKSRLYLIPRKVKRHLPRLVTSLKNGLANPRRVFNTLLQKCRINGAGYAGSKKYYRRIRVIQDKLRLALQKYSLEPFDDKVYLFKAKTCDHYVDDAVYLGWKKYAKKGVEIFDVPGNHLSMMVMPNVKEFALILQQGIDKL